MRNNTFIVQPQELRVPEFDDSWANEYVARDAMMAVRDGNNAEFFRLYPQFSEHKDALFEVACDFGNLYAAQFLYQEGANVNGEDEPDNCPFMFALRSRNLEMIAWMLTLSDMNANVQMDCDGYYNGLAFAIDNNFPVDIMDSMIICGAEISEANGDFYPLSMAAHKGNAQAVALLLLHGADPNYVDDDDQSVAFYASGALKTVLELWSPAATEMMAHMLFLDPSLMRRPDILYCLLVRACQMAADEPAGTNAIRMQ